MTKTLKWSKGMRYIVPKSGVERSHRRASSGITGRRDTNGIFIISLRSPRSNGAPVRSIGRVTELTASHLFYVFRDTPISCDTNAKDESLARLWTRRIWTDRFLAFTTSLRNFVPLSLLFFSRRASLSSVLESYFSSRSKTLLFYNLLSYVSCRV